MIRVADSRPSPGARAAQTLGLQVLLVHQPLRDEALRQPLAARQPAPPPLRRALPPQLPLTTTPQRLHRQHHRSQLITSPTFTIQPCRCCNSDTPKPNKLQVCADLRFSSTLNFDWNFRTCVAKCGLKVCARKCYHGSLVYQLFFFAGVIVPRVCVVASARGVTASVGRWSGAAHGPRRSRPLPMCADAPFTRDSRVRPSLINYGLSPRSPQVTTWCKG